MIDQNSSHNISMASHCSTLDTTPKEANNMNAFAKIDECCWKLIAQFAAPPDVYNLALSSKHFFDDIPVSADEIERGAICQVDGLQSDTGKKLNGQICSVIRYVKESERYEVRMKGGSGQAYALKGTNLTPLPHKLGASNKYVASMLLRESLLVSLGRVLQCSDSGFTLDSLLALPDYVPEGSAVIAGSTVAQACLGELWNDGGYRRNEPSDVDIFCTTKEAPSVRSWLVEQANGVFVGFRDSYMDSTDDRLAYTVDTKIHHVEHWGTLEQNLGSSLEKLCWGEETVGRANKMGAGIGIDAFKSTEYYKTACSYGRACQTNYVDWKWRHGMSFDVLGVDLNKAYNIKAKNTRLPFDFHGDGNIDLVVARREVNDAFELLDDFDLIICKASFDGKSFHIPDPHLTFKHRSTMEPNRRAVVASYVKHYVPPKSRWLYGIEASRHARSIIQKVRRDVPISPFYKQLDVAARCPECYFDDAFDPRVQAKHSAPCLFHNWIRKLILRLKKYQARGIEVIGAPAIGDDFEIDELALMSWGG